MHPCSRLRPLQFIHRLMAPRSLVDVVHVSLAGDAAADVRPGNPDRQNGRQGEQQHPSYDRRPFEVEQAEIDRHPNERARKAVARVKPIGPIERQVALR